MEPAFIVVEGPDGIGKSTLAEGLRDWFEERGARVCLTMEPSEGVVGGSISHMIAQKELPSARTMALLFATDRSHHEETVIKPALSRGDVVICDRYDLSTMVYQLAQGMSGVDHDDVYWAIKEDFSFDWCVTWLKGLNDLFVRPAVTLVLQGIAPDETMRRIAMRKGTAVVFEKLEFQRKVHALYARANRLIRSEEVIFVHTQTSDTPAETVQLAVAALQRSGRVAMPTKP
jgi:dTMP kinase